MDNLDVGHVLTNKPDLRNDAPLDSTKKCNVKGTENIMGDTLIKEVVQEEEATKVNLGIEKPQILVVEGECNAIVDNVVEFSVIS